MSSDPSADSFGPLCRCVPSPCRHCFHEPFPGALLPLRAAMHAVVPFVALLPLRSTSGATEVLTQLEVCRTLQLCGVKRHRCREAVQQLWDHFFQHCYATQATCTEPPSDTAASIVRYAALRDAQSLMPVPLEVLVEAAVALQRSGSGSGSDCGALGGEADILTDAAAPLDSNGDVHSPMGSNAYTLVIARGTFERCIAKLLSRELRGQRITVCPLPRWNAAQAIVQHRRPLVIFCGGTSGCGKTTLASLVASHLGIGIVLSTDTIRQGLRKSLCRGDFPELYVSTYEAHRCVAAAATNKDTTNKDTMNKDHTASHDVSGSFSDAFEVDPLAVTAAYEKQCEAVLRVLDRMLERLIARNQAVVVEGVHLLASYMQRKSTVLRAQGVMCLPFLVSITKERRHMERFCTRAKYLNISPEQNKYIAHFHSIRLIQEMLLNQARQFGVRIVNNTNMDKSLMVVHGHLLDCIDSGGEGALPNCCSTYVDQGISGKRMLALLLLRRREKARRVAGTNTDSNNNNNNNNNNNSNSNSSGNNGNTYNNSGGHVHPNAVEDDAAMCECCMALSLLTQATRSRSAESLTSSQLRALSTCASVPQRGGALCAAGRTSPDSASSAETQRRAEHGVTDDEAVSRAESPNIQQQQQQTLRMARQRGRMRCASADARREYAAARAGLNGRSGGEEEDKPQSGKRCRWDIPSLIGS